MLTGASAKSIRPNLGLPTYLEGAIKPMAVTNGNMATGINTIVTTLPTGTDET